MIADRLAPRATYRLQLRPGFGFRAARAVVPYLRDLGVSHVYLSPVAQARAGSSHGYDVADPTRFNPELGTEAEFAALAETVHAHGMGILLDIVPNHLAATGENAWWADLLEYGRASEWAAAFDVDWSGRPDWPLAGRVLLPVLGQAYGEALAAGEIGLALDERGLAVRYYDHRFPLRPEDYAVILLAAATHLAGAARAAVETIAEGSALIVSRGDGEAVKRRLLALAETEPGVLGAVQRAADELAADAEALHLLLEAQHYQLAYWRVAPERVNYRRFFDISDLAGVRVEEPAVFAAMHALVERLLREGQVDGLRVDHIDGLFDPETYLAELRALCAGAGRDDAYLLVEKILGGDEDLPAAWPVDGTTGYDFLNLVGGLLIEPDGMAGIDAAYRVLTGWQGDFPALAREQERRMIGHLFPGQLDALTRTVVELAAGDAEACDLTTAQLRAALTAITAALPVYRTYATYGGLDDADRALIERAVELAGGEAGVEPRALGFVGRVLTLDLPARHRPTALGLLMEWQQLSGPVMAKGLEDTSLYQDTRLLALDDVGREPERDLPLLAPDDFHAAMQHRAVSWPRTMNATSTHDTKRSEDVRARLAVLPELAHEWAARVDDWRELTAPLRTMLPGRETPGVAMELLIYQSIVGAWPHRSFDHAVFSERVRAYVQKAAREAKQRTSWLDPDEQYEAALDAFVAGCLDRERSPELLQSMAAFAARLARAGAVNSLAQTLLKLTAPGVPDIYQGCELFDLSLADPDNRRPVDFERRAILLRDQRAGERASLLAGIAGQWTDDRAKLLVTSEALALRAELRAVFDGGDYLPLELEGAHREQAIAFARRSGSDWAITVAPRLAAGLAGDWGDTALRLPEDAPAAWRDVLAQQDHTAENGVLPLAGLFAALPVALLHSPSPG